MALNEEAISRIRRFLDILFLVGFPKLGNFAKGVVLFHNDNELKSKVQAFNRETILNVPNLRFPGFSGEWKQYTMGEITEFFSRRNKNKVDYPMFSVTNARGFVNQQEQFEDREMKGEDISAYKIVSPGEFAYNPARINVGSIARYNGDKDCMISSLYVCFKAKKELVDSQLLLHILKSPKMVYNYGVNGEGGVRIYLFYPNFARIRVKLPSLDEQRTIASFLDLIEERIQVQNKVIEDLKKLKTAIGERIFKLVQGKQISLGDILNERNEKSIKNNQYEVLSSTVTGIYSQREYFNKDIASANNSGYKIVHQGDIVMSPQNLWMGNINYNDRFERGIVSPSYKVFSIREAFDERYVAFLVKTKKALWEYSLVSEQGASIVRRNLNYESFLEISFQIPSYNEQKEVGEMIAAVNSKLLLEQKLLLSLSRQKSYYLSNMFI